MANGPNTPRLHLLGNDKETLGWLAGMFDGDGNVSIQGNSIKVNVSQRKIRIMQYVKRTFGGRLCVAKAQGFNQGPMVKWYASHRTDIMTFYYCVGHLLKTEKRRQLENGITKCYFNGNTQWRD